MSINKRKYDECVWLLEKLENTKRNIEMYKSGLPNISMPSSHDISSQPMNLMQTKVEEATTRVSLFKNTLDSNLRELESLKRTLNDKKRYYRQMYLEEDN